MKNDWTVLGQPYVGLFRLSLKKVTGRFFIRRSLYCFWLPERDGTKYMEFLLPASKLLYKYVLFCLACIKQS